MSRSHKKHPVVAHTSAKSEKDYKRTGNRRMRRAVKVALQCGFDEIDEPREAHFDPWNGPKDGKSWVGWSHPHSKTWTRK